MTQDKFVVLNGVALQAKDLKEAIEDLEGFDDSTSQVLIKGMKECADLIELAFFAMPRSDEEAFKYISTGDFAKKLKNTTDALATLKHRLQGPH